MSTIQSQVKKNVFGRFKVEGFTTLVKSSDILVKIMDKLGLLESQESNLEGSQEVAPSDGQVDVLLGNATEIFNIPNNEDYYIFTVRGKHAVPLIITLQINENPLDLTEDHQSRRQHDKIMEFQIHRYYRTKDPPSSSL